MCLYLWDIADALWKPIGQISTMDSTQSLHSTTSIEHIMLGLYFIKHVDVWRHRCSLLEVSLTTQMFYSQVYGPTYFISTLCLCVSVCLCVCACVGADSWGEINVDGR